MYQVARIDEDRCIGCTKCLVVCPTDAIVGAMNFMHAVIAADCIGCELCLPPCPVDCIELLPTPQKLYDDAAVRKLVKARKQRLARNKREEDESRERKKAMLRARAHSTDPSEAPGTYDPVAAALARARERNR